MRGLHRDDGASTRRTSTESTSGTRTRTVITGASDVPPLRDLAAAAVGHRRSRRAARRPRCRRPCPGGGARAPRRRRSACAAGRSTPRRPRRRPSRRASPGSPCGASHGSTYPGSPSSVAMTGARAVVEGADEALGEVVLLVDAREPLRRSATAVARSGTMPRTSARPAFRGTTRIWCSKENTRACRFELDALHRLAALAGDRVGGEQLDVLDELGAVQPLQHGEHLAGLHRPPERPARPVGPAGERVEVAVQRAAARPARSSLGRRPRPRAISLATTVTPW